MFGVKKSSNKIENLRELLIMQKSDELKETETIWDFVNNNFIGKNFGGKASTTDYLIMNIMNEWKSMFSYPEGFKQGIDIIVALLNNVISNPTQNILDLYKTNDWKRIIELRASVETVLKEECNNCSNFYFSMGMSGFVEGIGLVCNTCGNVYFKSVYDENKVPICECGGQYIKGCPLCSRIDSKIIDEISPYLYFSNHRYTRANGF